MQNETRMNQQFQGKQVDPSKSFVDASSDKLKYCMSIFASDDQSVIEFELYIQHLKEETSKLDRDMAKLAQLTEDLTRMITRAGESHEILLFSIFCRIQCRASETNSICKSAK